MRKIQYIAAFILFIFLFLPYTGCSARGQDIIEKRKEYPATKQRVKAKQNELRVRYESAESDEERLRVVEESRDYVFEILTKNIFPAWYGTTWGFNGTSRMPGENEIACGTFVVYTLQDAGFEISPKMARQPSENIIKNFIGPSHIKRFWNAAPMKKVLEWVG